MTTTEDHGARPPAMIHCQIEEGSVYSSLALALRDMRTASGRNAVTGDGLGNGSWIGLSIAMIVIDTLTGTSQGVGTRWKAFLGNHGVSKKDAVVIYKLRNAVLHGYHLPKPQMVGGRRVQLTDDQNAYAVDSSVEGILTVSVPVFCRCLTERLAYEAQDQWDETLIDTATLDLRLGDC